MSGCIQKINVIFEIEIGSIFSVFAIWLIYILALVLCTIWLFVLRIIVRTDGQNCQALIRACA